MVTGHPATGKTTLAHFLEDNLNLPLLWRDEIKETLIDELGQGDDIWSRKLGVASWALFYQQIETMLKAGISMIIESSFDPAYADLRWQRLVKSFAPVLIQVRCETKPATLLARYCRRVADGSRHIGHVDDSANPVFLASIARPLDFVAVPGVKLSFDTTELNTPAMTEFAHLRLAGEIQGLLPTG